ESIATCLFTDASDRFWSIVLTQCPQIELQLPVLDQRHTPLACMSGAFKGSELHWPIMHKEAYPIIHALDRLRHYLSFKPFHIFTDHKNLTYTLDGAIDLASRAQTQRLLRWYELLSDYSYEIHHIKGEDNILADILSRWRKLPTVSPEQRTLMMIGTIQARSDSQSDLQGDTSEELSDST